MGRSLFCLMLTVVGCSRYGFYTDSRPAGGGDAPLPSTGGDGLPASDSSSADSTGSDANGDSFFGDATPQGDRRAADTGRPSPLVQLPATVNGTEGGTAVVTVTLSAPSGAGTTLNWIAVGGTATSGEDFSPASGQLVIAPGQSMGTITVNITNDGLLELGETLWVVITDATGATLPALPIVVVNVSNVGGSPGIVKLAAGFHSTCALLSSGVVKCWGRDNEGQLGRGDAPRGDQPGEMAALTAIPLGAGVKEIARGAHHACAITTSDRVKCWGNNSSGRLGLGDSDDRGDDRGDTFPDVELGTGLTVLKLETGDSHTCALMSNDRIKCWGSGATQLGLEGVFGASVGNSSAEMGDNLPFIDLGPITQVTDFCAGGIHNCAVLVDGSLKCWGNAGQGALGSEDEVHRGGNPGDMGMNLPIVDLGMGVTASKVACGEWYTCAIVNAGQVKCWGNGSSGKTGQGTTADLGDEMGEMGDMLPYVQLGMGRTAQEIYSNMNHSCVILDGGDVKCWGSGGARLGYDDTNDRGDQLTDMGDNLPVVNLGQPAIALALSTGGTCALLMDGSVKCFGGGLYGALGSDDVASLGDDPGEMAALLPLNLDGTAIAVADGTMAGTARHYFNCAVLSDNTARCWGRNLSGQLGYGHLNIGDEPTDMGNTLIAVDLGATDRVVDITAGEERYCALLESGTVKCWGRNNGRLGTGTSGNRGDEPNELGAALPPVDLGPGLTARKVVAASEDSTCAILNDFTIKCWGLNSSQALGNAGVGVRGSSAAHMGVNLPRTNLGAGRWVIQLAGGHSHFCALLDDRTIKCWGGNGSGQLGQEHGLTLGGAASEMGDNLLPVQLGLGLLPLQVVAGSAFSCARFEDGSAKCWGEGSDDRLGNGTTADRGDDIGEMGAMLPFLDAPPVDALHVTGPPRNACARLTTGGLRCWGLNGHGQLGQGVSVGIGPPSTVPDIDLGTTSAVLQVVTGFWHNCARFADGTARCWGAGQYGALGNGDFMTVGDDPMEMGAALISVDPGN